MSAPTIREAVEEWILDQRAQGFPRMLVDQKAELLAGLHFDEPLKDLNSTHFLRCLSDCKPVDRPLTFSLVRRFIRWTEAEYGFSHYKVQTWLKWLNAIHRESSK